MRVQDTWLTHVRFQVPEFRIALLLFSVNYLSHQQRQAFRNNWLYSFNSRGFLDGSDGKESAWSAGDPGLIPESGRFLGKGMATTPLFLPGESHGQRSLAGYNPWACKAWDTTEQLTHTHTYTHASTLSVHRNAISLLWLLLLSRENSESVTWYEYFIERETCGSWTGRPQWRVVRSSAFSSIAQFMKHHLLRDELLLPAKPCLALIVDILSLHAVFLSRGLRVENWWTVLEAWLQCSYEFSLVSSLVLCSKHRGIVPVARVQPLRVGSACPREVTAIRRSIGMHSRARWLCVWWAFCQ